MSVHTYRAIIVDDDIDCGNSLNTLLIRKGIQTTYFDHPKKALDTILEGHPPDLAFIDLRMPTFDGIEVLKRLKHHLPDLTCILMSGVGTVDSAVEAIKYGAHDFLLKPVRLQTLTLLLEKVCEKIDLHREVRRLREEKANLTTSHLIGNAPSMAELKRRIVTVSQSDATVLVLGESGTGKELIVDALHNGSTRKKKNLIKINCGAIPHELMEAELFGFEKGAFTGAVQAKPGLFELADGGTIFLDEVGELPQSAQVKTLRVLQDQIITRIGSTKSKKVNVRLISATNKDLYQAIQKGEFREDLFYRLNVIPIHVPPLRERTDDIPLLFRLFLDRYCTQYHKAEKIIGSKALAYLIQYPWPGNVRELEHLCEQLALTCRSQWIREEDLPNQFRDAKQSATTLTVPLGTPLKHITQQVIQRTLSLTGHNVTEAARILNIHPKTIRRQLKELPQETNPPISL